MHNTSQWGLGEQRLPYLKLFSAFQNISIRLFLTFMSFLVAMHYIRKKCKTCKGVQTKANKYKYLAIKHWHESPHFLSVLLGSQLFSRYSTFVKMLKFQTATIFLKLSRLPGKVKAKVGKEVHCRKPLTWKTLPGSSRPHVWQNVYRMYCGSFPKAKWLIGALYILKHV